MTETASLDALLPIAGLFLLWLVICMVGTAVLFRSRHDREPGRCPYCGRPYEGCPHCGFGLATGP